MSDGAKTLAACIIFCGVMLIIGATWNPFHTTWNGRNPAIFLIAGVILVGLGGGALLPRRDK